MALANNGAGAGIRGLLFFAGTEIGYNLYGSMKSSPETTHFRAGGYEGGGAPERVMMLWVWLANAKVLIIAGIGSYIARSFYPLFGGILAGGLMHVAYKFALHCAHRDEKAGGLGRGSYFGKDDPQVPREVATPADYMVPPGNTAPKYPGAQAPASGESVPVLGVVHLRP